MAKTLMTLISGQILDERPSLSLGELSRVSALSAEKLIELVELGVIEPYGPEPDSWRFSSVCIKRVRRAHRLQRDLGVNAAGVALALDLLDELEELRERLDRLQQ